MRMAHIPRFPNGLSVSNLSSSVLVPHMISLEDDTSDQDTSSYGAYELVQAATDT